jgi:DNA-directed RNA polymerase subunit RPC12/RpoP
MAIDKQALEAAADEVHAQEVRCPACGERFYTPYGDGAVYVHGISAPFPALSRRDNKTYICSDCGKREAFEDFAEHVGDQAHLLKDAFLK